MKFLNKIFLALGLVAVIAQPAKAEFENFKEPITKIAGTYALFGAACCGFTSVIKAGNATIVKVYKDKPVSKLLYGHSDMARDFKKNFGEAIGFCVIACGLLALSMSYLKA